MHNAMNATAITASATSLVASTGLAVGAIPIPEGMPTYLPWLLTVLGPVVTMVTGRVLSSWAAGKRARAAAKKRRAEELLADKDPTNDKEAHQLEEDADTLKAEADKLDALRKPTRQDEAA